MAGFKDPELVHLYPLPAWHGEAVILGNRSGLSALRDKIDRVLSGKTNLAYSKTEVFSSDGEGFDLVVALDNTRWKDGNWPGYGVPYSEVDDLLPEDADTSPPLEKITREGVER